MDQIKLVIIIRSGKVIDKPISKPYKDRDNENSKGKERLNILTPNEKNNYCST